MKFAHESILFNILCKRSAAQLFERSENKEKQRGSQFKPQGGHYAWLIIRVIHILELFPKKEKKSNFGKGRLIDQEANVCLSKRLYSKS